MVKRRPPVTDSQRLFFFGVGVLGIVLVAVLMEYVVDPPQPEPCWNVPYDIGSRPQCVEVRP